MDRWNLYIELSTRTPLVIQHNNDINVCYACRSFKQEGDLLTTATCDIAYSIKVSIKRKLIPTRYIPYPILAYIRSDSYLVS